jgi:hypothetical protein
MPSGGAGGTIIRIALEFLKRVRKRAVQSGRDTVTRQLDELPIPRDTVRKFSDYIFKPGATHGKDRVFRSFGYGPEHSEELAREFTQQAMRRYQARDFVLGRADEYGQRITVNIDLVGRGDAAGRSTTILSGWMIRPDGSLTLNTPFTGFLR